MEREAVIQIDGLKKQYKLGQIGGGTLQGDLQSWWARVRGKEDPNSKIGTDQRSNGKTFMALNGIDLTVYRGEALGIIGHNGAGKSTLLKILSRVTAPTEGEVRLKGRVASMLEVGTGFNGEMTGRENIYMNGAILGMTKAEVDAKMEQIIDFSECREFIDTPVKRYSSGMYVKLAFSVAAHLDAEIMIMDEVLAVGDMKFQQKCLGRMGDAASQEGRTVLYVSHNMNTIRQLCTRCVVLDQGRVIFDGDVEEAIQIYMDTAGELCTKRDLRFLEGKEKESGYLIFQELEILGKAEARFTSSEAIHFCLSCVAQHNIKNVYLRMEVQYADQTMAGTSFSDKPITLEKGQIYQIYGSLPLGCFTPGRFNVSILAYQANNYGTEAVIKKATDAFKFEIESQYNETNLVWNHKNWGHIRLPNFLISKLEAKNRDNI